MHAAFGVPDADGDVWLAEPREAAAHTCRQFLVPPSTSSECFARVRCTLWSDLVVPYVRGERGVDEEAHIFWANLPPAFQLKYHQTIIEYDEQAIAIRDNRVAIAALARGAFTMAREAHFFRRIAVAFGDMPSNGTNYFQLSEGERTKLVVEQPGTHSWLGDNFEVMHGQLIVKGSGDQPFPTHGPVFKYAALFDSRPCFDSLRPACRLDAESNTRSTATT